MTTKNKTAVALISTALSAEDVKIVTNCIKQIKKTKVSIVRDILAMGEYLAAARCALDKYGSKAFSQFLNNDEVHISRRAAEEYMHAHDSFAEMPKELTGQFTAKALYRLSAPGSPDEAPEAAIEKARQGIRMTEKSARELVDELTPAEPTAVEPVEPWNEPRGNGPSGVAAAYATAADVQKEPGGDPATDFVHSVEENLEPTRGPLCRTTEPDGAGRHDKTRVPEENTPSVGTALDEFTADDPLEPAPSDSIFDDVGHDLGHPSEGRVAAVFSMVQDFWGEMLDRQEHVQELCETLLNSEAGEGLARVGVLNDIKRMVQKMEQLKPYSICPKCYGEGCIQCGERGWVNATAYMQSYTQVHRDELDAKMTPTAQE